MTETRAEPQILGLATSAVPSLSRCQTEAVYLEGRWRFVGGWDRRAGARSRLEGQIAALDVAGGAVEIPGQAWGWAYSLTSLGGAPGYLVVGASNEPLEYEQFVLRALAQQIGVALANARLHHSERASAEELRVANLALQRSMDIHQRLTQVAVAGEGQEGLARAVHELTGYPVAVEDRYGNLVAWAGPNRPDPYPRDAPRRREQLLRRAGEGRPIRDRDRLLVLAQPRDDVMGVVALIDPEGTAGAQEQVALEHAGTVLAMKLARLQSLAETERRLRSDLVEELLAGADEAIALHQAQALGYDLGRTHRVVVVEGRGRRGDDDAFFHAVRRAARDVGVGSLLAGRSGAVVVLSDTDQQPWEQFRTVILDELGRGSCRIGVGGRCETPGDFPRSYREAQLALRMQRAVGGRDQATVFEDLGIYRVLSEVPDTGSVERLVGEWLGPLLDYDARKGSQLVATLSAYLEAGGNYDATAKALSMHRSGLKYRLQRIRDVSGYDLADPDTHFNLQLASRAWRTLQAIRDS
jgi:sugar diacid utilization regulator